MPVTVDISDPARGSATRWMDRPPHRCTRGHWLLPENMIVYTIPCSCGDHVSWECECSAVTYGPALTVGCSLLERSAPVRK
jgi:hypothetical protein